MSSFDLAVQVVLAHEGGYVNDRHDRGGETNFGISKRAHPEVDIRALTREQAIEIYREHYWLPVYEQIADQSIANKLFCLVVNLGHTNAHRCLQRAVRAASRSYLQADGVFGRATLEATNRANPVALLAALKSEAAGHYRSLNQPRFLAGWLSRAYA